MIKRVWRGWSAPAGAEAYQDHFRTVARRNLERVPGFRGADLWRREVDGEVELVAVTTFESVEAVRRFAGEDYERAVVEPEARRVLTRFDERCAHYEVAVS